MSEYTIIDDVTDTLLAVLRANTNGLIAPDHISGRSPADVGTEDLPLLSLFLYQAGENKHLKNQDMQVIDAVTMRYPPLSLQLFYLLSAHARQPETEQRLIGRAMQILYDYSNINGSILQGSLAGTSEEIIVVINPLTIDDMNKLWSLFGSKPYKLSVGYQVSTALIDSTRERAGERVIHQTVQYTVL